MSPSQHAAADTKEEEPAEPPSKKRRSHPSTTAAAPQRQRRNGSNNNRNNNENTHRRPPPPPPPPASLVRLLQSDAAVLAYFQSLQANLAADVQVWKDRASIWRSQRLVVQSNNNDNDNSLFLQQPNELKNHERRKNEDASRPSQTRGSVTTRTQQSKTPTNQRLEVGNKHGVEDNGSSSNEFGFPPHSSSPVPTATATKLSTPVPPFLEGVPIDDSMFDDDDDDEDDDKDDDDGADDIMQLGPTGDSSDESDTASTPPPSSSSVSEVFDFLQEAFEAFVALGIPLVQVHDGDELNKDDDSPPNSQLSTKKHGTRECDLPIEQANMTLLVSKVPKCIRIQDDIVMTDLLNRIRNNTLCTMEVETLLLIQEIDAVHTGTAAAAPVFAHDPTLLHALVDATHLIPCCNPVPSTTDTHATLLSPVLKAKRLLIRALALIDTFCSPTVTSSEWDAYFVVPSGSVVATTATATARSTTPAETSKGRTDTEAMSVKAALVAQMKVGLWGRKRLVDRLLRFLDREIVNGWACADRSKRQKTTALHLEQLHHPHPRQQAVLDAEETDQNHVALALFGEQTSKTNIGSLVERSICCQIASTLHLVRNDTNAAACNILQYALSSSPSLTLEDYPNLPPILSMVALESLLLQSDQTLLQYYLSNDATSSWFDNHCSSWWSCDNDRAMFYQSLAIAIHVSASIWSERLRSSSERIHDVACIEVASYRRLLQTESAWLLFPGATLASFDDLKLSSFDWLDLARGVVNEMLEGDGFFAGEGEQHHEDITAKINYRNYGMNYALHISLTLRGDVHSLTSVIRTELPELKASASRDQSIRVENLALNSSLVRRSVALRSFYTSRDDTLGHPDDGLLLNLYFSRFDDVQFSLAKCIEHRFRLMSVTLECAALAADGVFVLRALQRLIELQGGIQCLSATSIYAFFDLIRRVSQLPVVRVINLQRRKDRMKEFMFQSICENLVVIKAVTFLKELERVDDPDKQVGDGYEFGLHAIDGQGRLVEANAHLDNEAGLSIDKLVATHWRPNDLRPFDRNAPDDEALVRMSPSERACALSHVASWRGVQRSLQVTEDLACESIKKTFHLLRSPNSTLRLFKISGFASGPALLNKNDNLPPTPVCVILEDDAILVDQFTERLNDLLHELPRDFHFCSLGYSRPKSAPIVPFSSKIGIPSMLWYLTGYCLSDAGAKYLLDSLPVVGPVDSWIGLKMTRNWENDFGSRLGVGMSSKSRADVTHSHVDLVRILQFRAYCALVPLCSQEVRVATLAGSVVAAATGKNWRQRDTDIVYSGDMARLARSSTRNGAR